MQCASPPPKTHTALLRQRASSGAADGAEQDKAQATLAEIFPETAVDGAATAFALAHLRPGAGPVLWIQDRLSLRETGRPCLAGICGTAGPHTQGPHTQGLHTQGPHLLHLTVSRAADVLWAMEEGLRCPSLGAVIGEVWGNAGALDFTATKRLALRSEAHGVPAWLIRRAATPDLSAARERWRLASLPSLPQPHDMRAPGLPLWRADLFRARWRTPGQWVARHGDDGRGLVLEHGLQQTPGNMAAQQRAAG